MKEKKNLLENIDYYILPDGKWVITDKYHLERGFCCKSKVGCLHCPYGHLGKIQSIEIK